MYPKQNFSLESLLWMGAKIGVTSGGMIMLLIVYPLGSLKKGDLLEGRIYIPWG